MCSTCGCDQPDGVTITKVGESKLSFRPVEENHLVKPGHHHTHDSGKKIIEVEQDILAKNNKSAQHNRFHFKEDNIVAINLVSSPGSGKTSLLEKTLKNAEGLNCYVIEGDQQTMNDANRIAKTGVPVVQINTGKGCHLDADMIHHALHQLNPAPDSFVFIENVGNLVCPALFDLGEDFRVAIISVTEGDDKPLKYPDMFEGSDLCIINKMDLLPYVDFDIIRCKEYARRANPNIEFLETSATRGEGIAEWVEWLREKSKEHVSV